MRWDEWEVIELTRFLPNSASLIFSFPSAPVALGCCCHLLVDWIESISASWMELKLVCKVNSKLQKARPLSYGITVCLCLCVHTNKLLIHSSVGIVDHFPPWGENLLTLNCHSFCVSCTRGSRRTVYSFKHLRISSFKVFHPAVQVPEAEVMSMVPYVGLELEVLRSHCRLQMNLEELYWIFLRCLISEMELLYYRKHKACE